MLMKLVIVSLLICDLRWRRLWLRAPIAALLFWLALSATAVGPAMRRALEHQHRVPWPIYALAWLSISHQLADSLIGVIRRRGARPGNSL